MLSRCRGLQDDLQAKAAECDMQLDVIAGMREEYRALSRVHSSLS